MEGEATNPFTWEYLLLFVIPALLYVYKRYIAPKTKTKKDDKFVGLLIKGIKIITFGRAQFPEWEEKANKK